MNKLPDDFRVYTNILALSVSTESDAENRTPCDLLVEGDLQLIGEALTAKMIRNPIFAELICAATADFKSQNEKIIGGN